MKSGGEGSGNSGTEWVVMSSHVYEVIDIEVMKWMGVRMARKSRKKEEQRSNHK